MKDSDQFCGDAISNFKTVQSFGYEDVLVEEYIAKLDPVDKVNTAGNVKIGFAFGIA